MRQTEFKRKFLIHTKEVRRVTYYVEAFNEQEAIHMATVQQPNVDEDEMHIMHNSDPYESTLPFPVWDIEEVDDAPPG